MYNLLVSRRRRRRPVSRKDYTKDRTVRWFIALLVALAVYIIIDTVVFNNQVPGSLAPPKTEPSTNEKKTEDEGFNPRRWN